MSFDPNSFMQNTEVAGAMETKFQRIPPGEYTAVIEKVDGREAKYKDKQTGEDRSSPCCDITYAIDDAALKETLGVDKPRITQGIFLDVNSAGQLEMGPGKNIKLGQLRQACNQNDPSKTWRFPMLQGQVVKVKVAQSPNPKDPNDPYSNVVAVAAA